MWKIMAFLKKIKSENPKTILIHDQKDRIWQYKHCNWKTIQHTEKWIINWVINSRHKPELQSKLVLKNNKEITINRYELYCNK